MMRPMNRSAVELAAALARRELSAEALWRETCARIAEREPALQAFASLDVDAVLAQARALDAAAPRGPLHGLPLGVKDLIDAAGWPSAYGSPVWAGHRPRADAAAVAACRAAGALVAGKTVTTEFATFTPGPTRNPHDTGRTPGGSSSGSAAAVAAGLLPLALGTQTAGSIVRPAAYCGVVGFKPTLGRVARAGIKLQSDSCDTIGGLARSVEDVALLAAVLTGDDALCVSQPAPPRRLGLFRGPHWDRVDADVQALWQRVAARAGAAEVDAPTWFAPLTALQAEVMQHEAARNLAWEHAHHRAQLSERLQAMLDGGAAIDGARHAANLAAVLQARCRAETLFGGHDLLLAPSTAGEAVPIEEGTGDPLYCRAWSLLGLPCLHLPLGRGAHGLPIGLQLVGRAGDDARVLHAGAWLHARLRD